MGVHKKMLAVVVAQPAESGEFQFEREKFGTYGSELQRLSEWLAERQVREVVMEVRVQPRNEARQRCLRMLRG